MNHRAYTGLDVLCREHFRRLAGRKVGLVTHAAAVDAQFQSAAELIGRAPSVRLTALFGPEHGLHGHAQDLVGVADAAPHSAGVPCHSLYGATVESLRPTPEQLRGLDLLVIDLQDIGSRYYTFQATMLYCLEAAARQGLPILVLDRPNPLGGEQIEGPLLRPGFESFVGPHSLPIRHGLRMGELALLYREERRLDVLLEVIRCEGWQRGMTFEQTGLPWVLPSPNMPTLETAFVYPGQCLLEGTNLSEGRGTTRPFEICGAPWIPATLLADFLRQKSLPGVVFRPLWFEPTFHKFQGQVCGGVQVHVLKRDAFRPVQTGLTLLVALRKLSEARFQWRTETYEFVSDRPAIDLLFGSERERLALEADVPAHELAETWKAEEEEFRRRREAILLYS